MANQRATKRERRVGFVALARPTFDLELARVNAAEAFSVLKTLAEVVGEPTVRLSAAEVAAATDAVLEEGPVDAVVLLFSTFTDATVPLAAHDVLATAEPAERGSDRLPGLILWSIPEPRVGGRLRSNGFCGVNLASFSLHRRGVGHGYLHVAPAGLSADRFAVAIRRANRSSISPISPLSSADVVASPESPELLQRIDEIVARLMDATIGVVGHAPDGFEPCDYEASPCPATGARFSRIELERLFSEADRVAPETIVAIEARVDSTVGELATTNAKAVERSLRLFGGLRGLADGLNWQATAVRCWPECMTQFGGAACAPLSMLTSDGVPATCEADAYGALTSLMLGEVADAPVFVADLVDIDEADDTGVFWHCGLAPVEFARLDRKPMGVEHSNRNLPLLFAFGLRPGRVTIARISRSGGRLRLMIGGGEILDRPAPFSGTSGVVAFDAPAAVVIDAIMTNGLEHHYALVYGEHRNTLRLLAKQWGMPVLSLDLPTRR